MTYSVAWDETVPAGSAAANQLDTFIKDTKIAVRERMESLGVTDFESDDPVGFAFLQFENAVVTPYLQPGTSSTHLYIKDKTGAFNNVEISDAGAVTVRAGFTVTAGGLTITAGTSNLKATVITGHGRIVPVALGNMGSTETIDFSTGNIQYGTLDANCTITLSNPAEGGLYTIFLKQDATGSRTVTWATSISWAGGSAPTLTTTAAKTDVISLSYINGVYIGIFAAGNA